MVAVPVHTAVLHQDGQCALLDVNTLKVEPEVQLQRLRRRRLDAAVLVLDMEEEIGCVLLGEVAMCARLATFQLLYGGEDVAQRREAG